MLPGDSEKWFLTFDDLDNLDREIMSKNALAEYDEKFSPESSLSTLETIYSEFHTSN